MLVLFLRGLLLNLLLLLEQPVLSVSLFFPPLFFRKRVSVLRHNITLHFTYNEDCRKRGLELQEKSFVKLKFVPKEFISPISIAVYGNKSAIIRFKEKPITILIGDSETSRSFRNYFNLLWKIAKK